MTLYIDIQLGATSNPAKKYDGWRVKGNHEGGYQNNPLNMPMVVPPTDPKAVKMTKEIQQMSFELMRHFNSGITPKKWTAVHNHDRAFTNYNGFNKTSDPRANYILNENLSSPLPKYDKAQRLSLNQFVRGEATGGELVCTPGVHGIDANQPMPSIQTIVDNNWYLHAITYYEQYTKFGHFPQGDEGAVVIPFIFAEKIRFPLWCFKKWESNELPDPLKVY